MIIKIGVHTDMCLVNKLWVLPLVLVGVLLISCDGGGDADADASIFRGFNFLQDSQTPLDSPLVCSSLLKLHKTGANSVIFIPFMKQDNVQSTNLILADNVTDKQLISGIREAKRQGLHVVVKPQLLVSGSWAGAIMQATDVDERTWFKRYIEHVTHYAKIAEANKVDALVVGTEMKQLRKSQYWPDVIQVVRRHFNGRITYAAHGIEGIVEFPYWGLLDSIGVTLYPVFPKKADAGQVLAVTNSLIDRLREVTKNYGKKAVWILEIGMPSAEGWEQYPWDWQKLHEEQPPANSQLQAGIIRGWLTSVNRPWIKGVWIWQWSSSPQAGGEDNAGYTVQNKPAESIIQEVWQRAKPVSNRKVESCKN